MKEQSAVSALPVPESWESKPLGRITTRSREDGRPDWAPLSVFLGIGVVPRSEREDNHNQLGADLSKYLTVEPGDLVFNKLRTWQGGFGASTHQGIVSPAYYVLRPSQSVDSRYLNYLLHSSPYLAELTRLSKWMPPSQFDLPWENLKQLPIPIPPPAEQRRIADFLDDQVTRIDQAIQLRKRQAELLSQRVQSAIDEAFPLLGEGSDRTDFMAARRSLSVLPGWSFPSPGFSDDATDIRLLRGINVGLGRLRWDDVTYWPHAEAGSVAAFGLEQNDVVLGMDRPWVSGGVRIAQVGLEDLPCLLVQRVAKLIPHEGDLREYFFWAYQSTAFRISVEADLTGLSVPHLSADQILDFRLPMRNAAGQRAIAVELADISGRSRRSESATARSIELLEERKRSLITAAVTGEFDVSSASSRAAGVASSDV